MNRKNGAVLIIASLALVACSSRFAPAPVETLSTQTAAQNNLTEITGDTYTVQQGDTLFAIAFYSGNTYRDLAKLNNISAPYDINVGQTIRLKATPAKTAEPKSVVLEKTNKNSTNLSVDRAPAQEYGGGIAKKHRKNQSETPPTSIKSNNNGWIWPAFGEYKIATVGADGTSRGLDIKGPLGTKVKAARGGRVVYAGNALKGYGNLVIIKHDDEYLSAYAHNEKILVSEQSFVKQGQQIATMGQSGASEVMLHSEIRKKGKSRDPFLYLVKR